MSALQNAVEHIWTMSAFPLSRSKTPIAQLRKPYYSLCVVDDALHPKTDAASGNMSFDSIVKKNEALEARKSAAFIYQHFWLRTRALWRPQVFVCPQLHDMFCVIYQLCRARGAKAVVRLMPHEASELEPVIHALEAQVGHILEPHPTPPFPILRYRALIICIENSIEHHSAGCPVVILC